jgi:hypothetical protein
MAEKILNTRIQLKYDTLAKWQAGPFNGTDNTKWLKAGELAIVTLAPNKETNATNKAGQHPLLFKVGTGAHKFDDLPWASALAADVYDWAKKPEAEFITWVNSIVTHPTIPDGFTIAVNVTGDDVVEADLKGGKNSVSGTITHAKKGPTNGYTGGQTAATAEAFGESVTIKVPQLAVDAYGHVNSAADVEYKVSIPAAPEIPKITITDDGEAEVPTAATVNVYKNLTANGHALTEELVEVATAKGVADALAAAQKYADANDKDTNTAHTHSDGIGVKVTGNGGIDGDVKIDLDIKFNPDLVEKNSTKYLQILDNTNNNVIAEFDATNFIKDGFLQSVTKSATDNTITFTWNTDAGIDTTTIDIDELVEVYTAGDGIDITNYVVKIKDSGVTTAKIADKAVTEAKLAEAVTTKLNKTWEEVGVAQNLINGLDVTDITGFGAGKTLKTLTETDGKIAATFQDIAITESQITDLKDYALKSELPTVNDGKFTVSGTGYLTGTGSMTANQAGNSTANIDISNDAKEKIDGAVQSVTAGVGIKATRTGNDVHLDIVGKDETDEDGNTVVFILNCGGAE